MTVHEQPWGETREWYTPPELFAAIGLRYDLDPASPMSGPVPWVPADRFYSPRENGLTSKWEGRVWLNPPYGPPGVAFVQRMVAHGDGMLLLPARTETRAFQHAADAGTICLLRDRLHFIRADGFQARAAFGSVLFAFGRECTDALRRSNLGVVGELREFRESWQERHQKAIERVQADVRHSVHQRAKNKACIEAQIAAR